jgi:hypothetical protein
MFFEDSRKGNSIAQWITSYLSKESIQVINDVSPNVEVSLGLASF